MLQIRQLLDQEHIDEAVLIGHSMGGFTATQLAGGKGDARLRGLVLLAPSFWFARSEIEGEAVAKDLSAPYVRRTRWSRVASRCSSFTAAQTPSSSRRRRVRSRRAKRLPANR